MKSKRIRYKDLDKFVAHFALEHGYRLETAWKKLLWRNMENARILTEALKITREFIDRIENMNDKIDEEQLKEFDRIIRKAEENSWESTEKGWNEGYEDGANDFEEVEKRKDLFRKKGIPVLGDGLKKGTQ